MRDTRLSLLQYESAVSVTVETIVMLGFRYACLRHQQMFIATVEREGCRDPDQMEQVRRQMFAWLSEKLPSMVLDHFNAEACLGCAIENAHIDTAEMHQAFRDIVLATISGVSPRDARR